MNTTRVFEKRKIAVGIGNRPGQRSGSGYVRFAVITRRH